MKYAVSSLSVRILRNVTICVAPFTLPIFVNLILRHLYILLLQVNFSLKRIICCVILVGMTSLLGLQGLQADYQMKAQ